MELGMQKAKHGRLRASVGGVVMWFGTQRGSDALLPNKRQWPGCAVGLPTRNKPLPDQQTVGWVGKHWTVLMRLMGCFWPEANGEPETEP